MYVAMLQVWQKQPPGENSRADDSSDAYPINPLYRMSSVDAFRIFTIYE